MRRTYLGDRLCFPHVADGRPVDVQAAYARMLTVRGSHRDDAMRRSRREIPETLPELLQADPDLAVARAVHEWASAAAGAGDLTEDCTWSADRELLGPPIGRPHTIWGMSANYPRERRTPPSATRDVAELDNRRMDRAKGFDTGTPPGVSSIQPGNELRGEIDGLGVVECTVVPEPSEDARVAVTVGAAG